MKPRCGVRWQERVATDEVAVVISATGKSEYEPYKLSDAEEEALLDRFRR